MSGPAYKDGRVDIYAPVETKADLRAALAAAESELARLRIDLYEARKTVREHQDQSHECAAVERACVEAQLARNAAELRADLAEQRAATLEETPARKVRTISPCGPHEDKASCAHVWEPHLWEIGVEYCPYCTSHRAAYARAALTSETPDGRKP